MSLRIALVTPMLPVPHDQTRGRYIHETARSLAKIADVKVFFHQCRYPRLPLIRPRSYLYGEVGDDYTIDGIDVEAYSYPAFPVVSRALNPIVAAHRLTPRARRFRPDLMLAYWVYPDGMAALRTARTLGVPCVVGALGSDIHVRSGHNAKMTQRTIEGVDALVTVSEAMRQYAIREYGASPDRVHTVINGFNTQVFRPMDRAAVRAKWGVRPDERLIVYVGRFVEAKGMRELVTAFQTLARDDARVTLALIGDGVMRDELISLLESTGLRDRLHLPGGQSPEGVAEWVNASDVCTLPSWSEGYPNSVVEGVACGRPVVATDVGGTREILNGHNGILIPPKDPEVLARALREALDRAWDHEGIAAAMKRTWDDVAVETLRVCEDVVARHRRR